MRVADWLDFRVRYFPETELATAELATNLPPHELPSRVLSTASVWFDQPSNGWRTVYTQAEHPVLLERPVGRGSMVVAASSYCVSNEALRDDPPVTLLTWLVGGRQTVVFDETHHGVTDSPGVATLLRRYRLYGCLGALLWLAVLFIWQQSRSLVPPAARNDDVLAPDIAQGRDATAGLINLLRRSTPPARLLDTLYQEWQHTGGATGRVDAGRQAEVRQLIAASNARPAGRRDLAGTYNAIARVVKRKWERTSQEGTGNPA